MQPLTQLTYNKLVSAFRKKKKYYGTDPDFTQAVNDNLFVFSAFKTYAELRAVADMLLDADGMLRPFAEFMSEVASLGATFNVAYLQSEYNHAVATAQHIVRWKKFEEEKSEFDLIFDAVNDSRTRPSHRALDGIVRPVDDSFWDTHSPPLDWGCRCFLRQVPKGTTGAAMPAELPELKPMFATNPAKTGIIFPTSHPYFDVAETERNRITGIVSEMR